MLPTTHQSLNALFNASLTNRRFFLIVCFLTIVGDALLTQLIIRFIPYTEIDWKTYMVHVDVFLKGQHNYTMITGPTGPLVYPAGHIRIHQFLHKITDSGRNVSYTQQIYAALYTTSLGLSCIIYGKAGGHPKWIFLLLPLSKRLHSIFVLRLFNDCWAVLATQAAILMYQFELDNIATILYSAALSIKMSVLLYLPGVFIILFKRRGLISTSLHAMTIFVLQTLIAAPFLSKDTWAYINSAFDLRRVFLYKWTVNWRFLPEDIFLSFYWALTLLMLHGCALVIFCIFRWCKVDGNFWTVIRHGLAHPQLPGSRFAITPDHIATIFFTCNLIGIIFARSLHYQFYSWYAYQLPFLAWRTPYSVALKFALLLAIEYSWNVYPSTSLSSLVLLCANTSLLFGVWYGRDTTYYNDKGKTA